MAQDEPDDEPEADKDQEELDELESLTQKEKEEEARQTPETQAPEAQDQEPDPPLLAGEELNAELFQSAVKSLREVIPAWQIQPEMLLGHSVDFIPDFDSLEGRYDRIQPFVHGAITGTLDALTKVRFDPAFSAKIMAVQSIVVRCLPPGRKSGAVMLSGTTLTVCVPLELAQPTGGTIADAIRAALGSDAATTPLQNEPVQPPIPQPVPPPVDPYQHAAAEMARLEEAMRDANLWPAEKPPEPLVVQGAFGTDNLRFEQWLAWVLIPRVEQIVADRGQFPSSSSVAAYASTRGFDGIDGAEKIIEILADFDDFIVRRSQ